MRENSIVNMVLMATFIIMQNITIKQKNWTDALEQEVNFVAEERGIENYNAPTDLKGYYKDLNTFMFTTTWIY